MVRRTLVITVLTFRDLGERVHGAYQRFRTLLEATCNISESVDVCSIGQLQSTLSNREDEESESNIWQHWGLKCRVFAGAWDHKPMISPWILEQILWAMSYRRCRFFWGLDNTINRELLARLSQPAPGLIVLHKLQSIELAARILPSDIPVCFDLDDIEYIAHERHSRLISNTRDRLVALGMVPAIKRAVYRALRRTTHTFVCSLPDKELLDSTFGLAPEKVVVIPNSFAIQNREPIVTDPVLLFVGTFAWEPNVQAMDFFLTQCWQQVKAKVPDARLLVVGKHPEKIPSFSRIFEGVEFSGFVEDIAEAYRKARVVICPILSGGGTRVKLVEAAAYGKPIVSTRIGAEGLGFADEQHALLRDGAKSFADACIRLLKDKPNCESLSESVHNYAEQIFDRPAVIAKVRSILMSCTS